MAWPVQGPLRRDLLAPKLAPLKLECDCLETGPLRWFPAGRSQKKVPKVYYDSILEGYPPDLTLKLAKEFDVNIIKLERKEDG